MATTSCNNKRVCAKSQTFSSVGSSVAQSYTDKTAQIPSWMKSRLSQRGIMNTPRVFQSSTHFTLGYLMRSGFKLCSHNKTKLKRFGPDAIAFCAPHHGAQEDVLDFVCNDKKRIVAKLTKFVPVNPCTLTSAKVIDAVVTRQRFGRDLRAKCAFGYTHTVQKAVIQGWNYIPTRKFRGRNFSTNSAALQAVRREFGNKFSLKSTAFKVASDVGASIRVRVFQDKSETIEVKAPIFSQKIEMLKKYFSLCAPIDAEDDDDAASQAASFRMNAERFAFPPDCQWYVDPRGKAFTLGRPCIDTTLPEKDVTIPQCTGEHMAFQSNLLRRFTECAHAWYQSEKARTIKYELRLRQALEEQLLAEARKVAQEEVNVHDRDHGVNSDLECQTKRCQRRQACVQCEKCIHHCRCPGARPCECSMRTHLLDIVRFGAGAVCTTMKPNAQVGLDFNFNVRHDSRVTFDWLGINEFLRPLLETGAPSYANIAKDVTFLLATCWAGDFKKAVVLTALAHFVTNLPCRALLRRFAFSDTNAQAGLDDPVANVALVLSAIVCAMVGLLVNKLPSDKTIDTFINRFSRIGHMITSVEKMSGVSEKLSKLVVSFVKKSVLGYDDTDLREWEKVDEWMKEVRQQNTVDLEERLTTDKTVSPKIDTLLQRGYAVLKMCDDFKVPRNQMNEITACMMFLHRARETAAGVATGVTRPRIAPITIHLVGNTGVGKSSCLGFLESRLLVAMGCTNPNDLYEKVYNRRAKNEFWDGFREGTKIIVYDDFGSLKDTSQRPSDEVHEQILVNNTASMQLPMAHLVNKGRYIMEAPVIIWTTNRDHFIFDSLTNPEAVLNRVNLRFRQYPRPEYTMKKRIGGQDIETLDQEKLAAAAARNPKVLRDCWLFDLLPANATPPYQPIQTEIPFDEMCLMCEVALLDKQIKGDAYLQQQKDYFQELLDEKNSAPNAQAGDKPPPKNLTRSIPRKGQPTRTYDRAGLDSDTDSEDESEEEFSDASSEWETDEDDEDERPVLQTIPEEEPEDIVEFPLVRQAIPEEPVRDVVSSALETEEEPKEVNPFQEIMAYSRSMLGDQQPGTSSASGAHKHPEVAWNVVVFDEPNFFMRYLGKPVHINLYDTLYARHAGFVSRPWKRGARKTVLERFAGELTSEAIALRSQCAVLKYSDVPTFIEEIDQAFYERFVLGEPFNFTSSVPFHFCTNHMTGMEHPAGRYIEELQKVQPCSFKQGMLDYVEWAYTKYEDFLKWVLAPTSSWALRVTFFMVLTAVVSYVIDKLIAGPLRFLWRKAMTTINPEIYDENPFVDDWWKSPKVWARAEQAAKKKRAAKVSSEAYSVQPGAERKNTEGYDHLPSAVRKNTEGYDHLPAAARKNVETAYTHQPGGARTNTEEGVCESFSDANAADVRRKVYQNAYSFQTKSVGEESWTLLGTCTIVQGRVALMNKHFLPCIKDEVRLVGAGRKGGAVEYAFPRNALSVFYFGNDHPKYSERDVCLVELPRNFPLHSSILHMFMTQEDFCRHQSLDKVTLCGYDKIGALRSYSTDKVQAEDTKVFELIDNQYQHHYVRQYYRYGIDTEPGDCGSLLVAFDKRFNRKIVAIHMAGSESNPKFPGIGCAVHQEMLKALVEKCQFQYRESWFDREVPVDFPLEVNVEADGHLVAKLPFEGAFHHVGKVQSRVHSSGKSNLRRSPIFGVTGEVHRMPAHLKPVVLDGVKVDPLVKARAKACTPSLLCNQKALKQASHAVKQLLQTDSDLDKRVLTFEEMVAGIEGDEHYPPINRSSSAGFGWPKSGKGKQTFLGSNDYKFDHPLVLARYEEARTSLKAGKPIAKYWTDTLKDELRSEEKVMNGKTRLFSVGEMTTNMLIRQYFGGFAAHMARNRVAVESCVGVNPYSLEWNDIYNVLKKHGPAVVAGDFTNYDGTLPADLLWEVLEVIESFYNGTEEEKDIRRTLWVEIVNSVHVIGDDVYSWNHSQPSGCAITSILNSTAHSILVRMVFLLCAWKYSPENARMDIFAQNVSHVNYGDDDVTNISLDIVSWFNQLTMAEAYSTFGMTYTDEAKSVDLVPFKTLEEVEFLKRRFRFDHEVKRVRAPLSLKTVLEMSSWVRGSEGYALAAVTLQQAAYELSQHEREVFEHHMPKFLKAAAILRNEGGVCVTLCTYDEYLVSDQFKYLNILQVINPFDQGFRQMAVSSGAANPAKGNAQAFVGGVFTSSGECVPAQVERSASKLLTPPTTATSESARKVERGLAQSTSESPISQPSPVEVVSVETEQIVEFHQDGDTIQEGQSSSTAKDFAKDAHDPLVNSVTDFLKRPVQLGNFDWTSSNAKLSTLFTVRLPENAISNKMWRNKLQHFKYLRCDFTIEVQLNAQPFNAGALIIWFEPLFHQLEGKQNSSVDTLSGVSGYPHVVYRVGDETAVRLKVPFFPTISHYDLVNKMGTCGRVRVAVLSPLTGDADVEGTVWFWADNVDLQMPTGMEVETGQAQSGEGDGTKEERNAVGITVEKLASVGARIATALTAIPSLAPVALLGSGVLSGVSAVAHFFGWSKPIDKRSAIMVQPTAGKYFTNFNGDVKGRVLALDANNAVNVPIEVLGKDDEMAFNTILRTPTIIENFQLAREDPVGALVYSVGVNPTMCYSSSWIEGQGGFRMIFDTTRLAYCSMLARLWRGSLKYRFQFIKTKFHSARVRVSFVPGFDPDYDDVNAVDWNACYTEVHDLRANSDIEFAVPFVANQPWLRTIDWAGLKRIDPSDDPKRGRHVSGTVFVHVLNALRAPPSVSSKIDCMVWVSAGEDFQLAIPSIHEGLSPLIYPRSPAKLLEAGKAQVGGLAVSGMSGTTANEMAVGEVFTGFRQWLRRFIPWKNPTTQMHPWVFYRESDVVNNRITNADIWVFVTQLYRFMSGPMRVAGLKENVNAEVEYIAPTSLLPDGSVSQDEYDSNAHVVIPSTEPYYELEVPFYQKWCAIPTQAYYPKFADGVPNDWVLPSNKGGQLEFHPAPSKLFRAAGEGFSFGYVLGSPRVVFFRT